MSERPRPGGQNDRRAPTATSAFGVGRRENHDASAFYARFTPPELDGDGDVAPLEQVDRVICGNSRDLAGIPDGSVALVVTSPPYFAGKEYEEALGQGHVPADYLDYLQMLRDVFAECARVLEPGGRIAVNVANLGRRPYRSLSSDVIGILQDDLRLLLRGEIIWQKARGAGGNCAWGSFQRPANPVLRDLTERIIVASKGRFDRALGPRERLRRSPALPHVASLRKDDFFELTTDVWEMPPESATRVGHPAPFPVELPERLIHLYTYVGDVVLDPFLGSGTTAVAALRAGRHYIGVDTDPDYCATAEARIDQERARLADGGRDPRDEMPALAPHRARTGDDDLPTRAVRDGMAARQIAEEALEASGFTGLRRNVRFPGGVEIGWVATDAKGRDWYVDVAGAFTSARPGLRRTDALWRALGKAAVLAEVEPAARGRLLLLTTHAPAPGSAGEVALAALQAGARSPIADVIELLDPAGLARLGRYGRGQRGRS